MDNLSQTLEVVSFTSNRVTEEICGLLAGLKYSFTMGNSSSCRIEETVSENKTVFVFLLDSALPQHLSIYLAQNLIPYLAIFCTPMSKWDHRIIELSKNFCGWPCQEQELDFRLQHVLSESEKKMRKA